MSLKKVALLPQWMPQAQFAGYMVAGQRVLQRGGVGRHAPEGRTGRASHGGDAFGRATFLYSWLSPQSSRGPRENDPEYRQIVQRSALMLISKKVKKIEAPKTSKGKKIGIWEGDFRVQPLAFFRMNHLNVQIVPMYGTINLFLKAAWMRSRPCGTTNNTRCSTAGLDPTN